MFKVELLTSDLRVVGFFEVAPTTPIASLPTKVGEAVKMRGAHSAVYWQVKYPDGRILFQSEIWLGSLEE